MKFWPIAALAIQLLTVWVCWSLRQLAITEVKKLVDAAVAVLTKVDEEAEAAIDDHESRIIKVEKDIEGLRDDVAALPTKADLAEVKGEVKAVGSEVRGARAGIDRIESFFLAKGVERA